MRILMSGFVRGRPISVTWEDGTLSGPDEVLHRLEHHGYDLSEPRPASKAIIAVEHVLGEEVRITHCSGERTEPPDSRPTPAG